MNIIDRPKSIVKQVVEILRKRIAEGTYLYGKRLPSESELAQEFGVSRATVRSALTILENEHLITRRQGDGTYLNERVMEISAQLHSTWDFQCMIADSGRTPSVNTLKIEKRQPNEQEAKILEINPAGSVIVLLRIFLADLRPVIYSKNTIAAAFIPDKIENLDTSLPIHRFFEEHCQQKISYSISDLSAVIADEMLSSYLEVKPGDALLKFCDVFYNLRNQPLMCGESYYDDKFLRLRIAHSW